VLKKFIIAGVVAATATLGVAGIAYADTGSSAHRTSPSVSTPTADDNTDSTDADNSDSSSDDTADDSGSDDSNGDDSGDSVDSADDGGGGFLGL